MTALRARAIAVVTDRIESIVYYASMIGYYAVAQHYIGWWSVPLSVPLSVLVLGAIESWKKNP